MRLNSNYLLVLLYSIFPFASFYGINVNLGVEPVPILIMAVAYASIVLTFYAVVVKITGPSRQPFVTGVFLCAAVLFFSFDLWQKFLAEQHLNVSISLSLALVAIPIIVFCGLVCRKKSGRKFFLVMVCVSLLFPIWQLASVLVNSSNLMTKSTTNIPLGHKANATGVNVVYSEKLPSVFYIIIDAYVRSDVLTPMTGFDYSSFNEAIEKRGFRFAKRSKSNFISTDFSVSSILSQDYPYAALGGNIVTYDDALNVLRGHNATVSAFHQMNYAFLFAAPRWCYGYEDRCISNDYWAPREVWRLLQKTPLPLILNRVAPHFLQLIASFGHTTIPSLQQVIPEITNQRVFLLAHSLVLHWPAYNADCSPRKDILEQDQVAMLDIFRFNAVDSRPYRETLTCIHKQIIDLSDAIIAHDPNAIIVFASDHGTHFSPWPPFGQRVSDIAIAERTANLFLARFPERCAKYFRDDLTAVNHFRFILGCVMDRAPEYLEDKFFVASGRISKDVTFEEYDKEYVRSGLAKIYDKQLQVK